jgi:hypothetical protein
MGTFRFEASWQASNCDFSEVGDKGFSFEGTFSRSLDEVRVFFTSQGINHPATFDGQSVEAFLSAPRQYAKCDRPVEVQETLAAALLSRSQLQRLSDCPAQVPPGGWPVDEAAGIFPPRTTPEGFDAVRACGTLTDTVSTDEALCAGGVPSAEATCFIRYAVVGVRR